MKYEEHYWIRWQKSLHKREPIYLEESKCTDTIQETLKVVEKALRNKKMDELRIFKTYSFPKKKEACK